MAEALRQQLGVGFEVTPNTLKTMVRMVRKYQSDLVVVRAARQITANIPERSQRGNVEVLQRWVRDNIKYVMDPRNTEMIQTPPETLRIGMGDCDDKSTLLATLLESLGYQAGFCALGFNGHAFSHVIALVRMGQKMIPLETILPGVGVGWSPPDATSHMTVLV